MWRGLVCWWFLWPLWSQAEVFWGQVTHVSDGDTLWVLPSGEQLPRKLRLQGLDAPEICQAGGTAAREALVQLVVNKNVQVSVKYHDSYGRGLARVRVNSQDVGSLMVQSGHAWSSRWHRSLGPYSKEEAQARAEQKGIFANLSAELPRDFRQRNGSCYQPQPNGSYSLKP